MEVLFSCLSYSSSLSSNSGSCKVGVEFCKAVQKIRKKVSGEMILTEEKNCSKTESLLFGFFALHCISS